MKVTFLLAKDRENEMLSFSSAQTLLALDVS